MQTILIYLVLILVSIVFVPSVAVVTHRGSSYHDCHAVWKGIEDHVLESAPAPALMGEHRYCLLPLGPAIGSPPQVRGCCEGSNQPRLGTDIFKDILLKRCSEIQEMRGTHTASPNPNKA